MDETHQELLRNIPVFGGLNDAALEFLVERAPVVQVPKGVYFFHENQAGDTLYVLERGEVSILKSWGGREYVLRYLRSGDCFGEIALLDLFPRSASVLATAPCSALELSSGLLYELCRRFEQQCLLVYINIARELARRARSADQRMFLERLGRGAGGSDWVFHAY